MIPRSREQLTALLREKLSTCVKCGACHAFCPTFLERRHEGAGMRGKLALLQAWVAGRDFPPADLLAAIEGNLDCFACRAACANAVEIPVILPIARLLLDSNLWARWSALSKPVVNGPAVTGQDAQVGSSFSEVGLQSTVSRCRTEEKRADHPGIGQIASSASLLAMTETMVLIVAPGERPAALALKAFLANRTAALEKPRAGGGTGDESGGGTGGEASGEAGAGTVEILVAKVPCRFRFDPPALDALDAWGRNLLATLATRSPAQVVVADPTWIFQARLFENLYFLSDEERSLLARLVDLGSFFAGRSLDGCAPREGTWTWHDPCFAARALGIRAQPRKLLSRLIRQPLVETAVEGACCGGKGAFDPGLAPIADRLLAQRVEQLARPGITGVVTSCPTCVARLAEPLRRRGVACRTLIDLLAECLA